MNCIEFEERLFGESRLSDSGSDALADHVRACDRPACARLWRQAQILDRTLAAWLDEPLPEVDLTRRVLAGRHRPVDLPAQPTDALSAVRPGSDSSTRPAPARAGWGAVIAAAGLLAAMGLILPEARSPDSTAPKAAAIADPATDDLAALGVTSVGFARNATAMVTDAVVLALPLADETHETNRAAEWFDSVDRQLTPLRMELDETWQRIRHVLPPTRT